MAAWRDLDRRLGLGFTLLSPWYHVAGLGAALMGLGLGFVLASGHIFRPCAGWGRWHIIGLVLEAIGAIVGLWAHRRIMTTGLIRRSDPTEGHLPCP